MRDYGKVHSQFWSSDTISGLSDDAKLLALYLMTSGHGTIAGAFRLPDGYVCEDLKWASERVGKGFAELFSKGFANRCETTKWVWIVKHLEWNRPENPNQRKAVEKLALSVPDACCWKREFMRVCGLADAHEEPADHPEKANPQQTLGEPFLNQKQKQEQKQEQKRGATDKGSPKGSNLAKDWTLPQDWREFAERTRPELDPDKVAAKFRDHWHGKPGKEGRKLDWLATWRNWVREERVTSYTKRAGGSDDWTRSAQ